MNKNTLVDLLDEKNPILIKRPVFREGFDAAYTG